MRNSNAVHPGGACQRKAQTPFACTASVACNGPASFPISAIALAVFSVSIPSMGVITNQAFTVDRHRACPEERINVAFAPRSGP